MVVKSVGIAGVTGKFARCVLNHLLKNPSINIQGYCRDPSKLPSAVLSWTGIQVIKGDASDMASLRAFAKGCDLVICCYLGDNELMAKGKKVLVDACELEAVPRFIASDYTLDCRNLEYGQLPPKDPIKEAYDHLQTKQIVKGGHVLIGTLSYWGTGEEIWELTTYDNAAEFIAAVALDESALGFQRFLGDRKNIKQIAQAFQETYAPEATLKHLGSLDDIYHLMLQT
ncbi:hypothetical protein ZTR_03748 [Talaromyces verruculosus]|nr:hypothetical protein ZTR_03748 [Talaromyces verruculosus]